MVDKPHHEGRQTPSRTVPKKTGKEKENFRGIVRLVGKDLNGYLTIETALWRIPGVGHVLAKNLARIAAREFGIGGSELIGNLTDVQLKKIEEVIREPFTHGVPAFSLNRPLHPQDGLPRHYVMADLALAVKQDIEGEKDIRSYRGWRHSLGQKVRGQHTRSTGRTGMTVGVLKKALKLQKAAAAATAQEGKEKKE